MSAEPLSDCQPESVKRRLLCNPASARVLPPPSDGPGGAEGRGRQSRAEARRRREEQKENV